ncbi:Icc-related predicted phosphoesterase [Saccharopolyspora erythraea NRRL 2338]|uniref:Metallophosphoesterase n=2 Tax=Saccharopolyspora erythraea TaxID=1836 RepID=A4FAD9_SACEN|nr:metallophosphoesterase [Saccharopolyspora erythraea]EQD86397.1 metallophosphoesterase [Saccharopolyspora erythraea D]PFG94800.1 Icc-related predicted phosphoesterase [Saccharopolyspora erythraea NRRL 2338]QRK91515.1 metallophosphoesterase family protein [Saccharopolyspora erythraea]CAM01014.1 metallophosphoesterase [Saccharopolyspora erythraea NRRL 2338]
MRVHVVSDVHGNVEDLKRAGDGADALVVLGDLIDFVDYHDHDKGILGAVFGPEKVARFAELRRGHRGKEISAYARSLWESLSDPAKVVEDAVRDQYSELFGAMTAPTYATPGNVDAPRLWPEFEREGIHVLDGRSALIGGLRFGFIGGTLLPEGAVLRKHAPWVPYLRPEQEYDDALAALDPVDVLCSHLPPAVPELLYDVVARRPEHGSAALLRRIRTDTPRWSLFGHVHQPLAQRVRIGRTECVNVGHFKRTGRPYVLEW